MSSLELESFTMQDWKKTSLLICTFGFLKHIRPSDPFTYHDFLVKPPMNLTLEQVNQEVLPVAVYSRLLHLTIVALLTDILRYKPMVILSGLSGVTVWSLFVTSRSKFQVQVALYLRGLFQATDVAYLTYVYAVVDKNYYHQATSYTNGATLAGMSVSGALSQSLVSSHSISLRRLHYITLSALILATIWSFFLPSVGKSTYFHSDDEYIRRPIWVRICGAVALMRKHFAESFSNLYVFKWSLWLGLTMCGFFQMEQYIQPLWAVIADTGGSKVTYNGAAEAVFPLMGMVGCAFAGYMKLDWNLKLELLATISSLVMGFITLILSQITRLWVSYALYIAIGGIYYFMFTNATAEIAKHISEDSYCLVIGFITFVALILHSLLTCVIVTKGVAFEMQPRDQFILYGLYYLFIAVIYIIIGLTNWAKAAESVYSRNFQLQLDK